MVLISPLPLMSGPSLAVVGSGPAAFYTAMRALQKQPNLRIAMFEKLAVPFGLTRFGVAPDHPEVKACQERFSEVASNSHFRFVGNCEIGRDISLNQLAINFDAVLLAYGAQGERKLNIPGEKSFDNVMSARQFVGWYNGEPQFQSLDMAKRLKSAKSATIVGNGNVALDVARILLRNPTDLAKTDITKRAVKQLRASNVRHVQIVGRRGVLQSAFTTKELRELKTEPGTEMRPVQPISQVEFALSKASSLSRQDKRKLSLITTMDHSEHTMDKKTWQLAYLRTPLRFVGENGILSGIEWQLNEIDPKSGEVKPTGHTEFQATDLVFTSIGYKSLPIAGMAELGIKFDAKRGVVPRKIGKVPADQANNIFAAGWVATGPVGVIASTMMDAFAVGEEIDKFLQTLPEYKKGIEVIEIQQSNKPVVSWSDWLSIDKEEVSRGIADGKPREKFLSTPEVLSFLQL